MTPVPKARSRIVRNKECSQCPYGKVHSYTPNDTTVAEAYIRSCLPCHHQFYPKGTAVKVEIIFFLTRPRSCPKKRKLPCVKPDIDNLEKLVWDSLKGDGGCYADDGQVTTCTTRKRYTTPPSPPRIEVDIEEDEE